MSCFKRGFFGKDAMGHHILHKKYGAGLIEDLQQHDAQFKIDSMDHKEYFEKYLMSPEGADKLRAAVDTICKYEKPEMHITVGVATVAYQTGINKFCTGKLGDNLNHVYVVFESFGVGNSNPGGTNGHFMLLWHFPDTFNKKETTKNKFCLFDPFGRERKNDPEINYYQKAKCHDFQMPTSSTCALWCIFALLQFALQCTRVPGIHPVPYSGNEEQLDQKTFQDMHERQWRENELALYRYLLKNYFIFQPRMPNTRSL